MNTRERFHAIMDFKSFDRLPILEWAPWWNKTIDRWHGETLPSNIQDRYEICEYFGLDMYYQYWYRAFSQNIPQPAYHGAGIVKNMDEYEKIRKYLFNMEQWTIEDMLSMNQTQKQDTLTQMTDIQKKGDAVFWFSLDGFFWLPRTLLGIENHLYAFYDEPELMHRINQENAEWMIKIIDRICENCQPDFMTFAEDMSYNNGPMLSETQFDEFMKPYYDIVVPHLKNRGIRIITDSDGDITIPASWFEKAGIEGILPLERQSGIDVTQLRKNHPDMLLIGAFDKMTMPKGRDAMRAEFERLLPVARKGGFLISCDHQTPPGVSIENYQIYLELFREFANLAGENSLVMA